MGNSLIAAALFVQCVVSDFFAFSIEIIFCSLYAFAKWLSAD